ncbi:MAG: hypothetical protein MASP_00741 [Candidatus Methanolliviera sp. GoM_asphalt]|nr:MAG: hypothetical protein MASP_00741 [Candidatus Methanolliviera sp. GoM_asphalt]
MENKKINEMERGRKRAQKIFIGGFVGSIALGFVMGYLLGSYWLTLIIIFVGLMSTAYYMKRADDKYKFGDERSSYINGRASAFAFKISFPTACVLMVVLGGLHLEYGIQLPAYQVLALIVALMGVTHGVASHHYTKKYN